MKTTLILSLIPLLYSSLFSSTQPMYAAVGDAGGYVRYFRLSDGVCLGDFHPDAAIGSVKISPDGEYALIGTRGVKYYHLPEGTPVRIFANAGTIYSVDISKDGLYALSGGEDLSMCYWRISDGVCLRVIRHTNWPFNAVCFSPDGEYALEAGGNICQYWRLSDGALIMTFTGHRDLVYSVDISPDGQYCISASRDGSLRLYDINTGAFIKEFDQGGTLYSGVFSPDGKYALAGGTNQTLKYWNINTGECIRTFTGHTGAIRSIDISIDGRYALSGSDDDTMKYWRISDGTCLRTMNAHISPKTVAFSPLEETGFKKTQSSLKPLPQSIVTASPNPFSNRLRVSLPTSGAVYTLTGRLIMKLDKGDHDIDTSNWKEGVYILKAGEEAKKIVKMENIFLLFLL
jgi:WD40 repeat protein